jgi:spore coat protein U-like protein
VQVYRKFLLPALLLAAGVLFTKEAAEAQPACTVGVLANVTFGTYDPLLSGNLDTTGTLRVDCTQPGAVKTFTLRLGTGSSGSFLPRRLYKGAESLTYNLYLDGAYSTIWGDGTSGTSFVTQQLPGGKFFTQTYILYARTPLGQDISAGAYSDVVTVTVEW